MKLYLGLDSQRLLVNERSFASYLEFKRRDRGQTLDIVCFNNSLTTGAIAPPNATFKFGVKLKDVYTGNFLFNGTLALSTIDSKYNVPALSAPLDLNTTSLDAAFTNEPAKLEALFEIEWTDGVNVTSSFTVPVFIHNDVIRGNEGVPASLPLFYSAATSDFQATKAQAEAGVDNATWMSPLRTAEAIAELAATDWTSISGKPATFTPSSHTHTIADTTGLQTAIDAKANSSHTHTIADLTQSGATLGQVQTWNGSAWTPTTPTTGAVSYDDLTNKPTLGTAAATDSTDYAAASHTHSIADVSNLQTELNSKQASGSYAAASHTHGNISNSGAIGTTSGVPIITGTSGVLQAGAFGTTSGTFAQGNHTHTFGTTAGTYCQGNDSRLLNLTGGITTVAVVATMPATPSFTTLYIVTG